MINKIISLFQKPTEVDYNGNVLQHESYKVEKPKEQLERFFEHPIARNVIKQTIVNKNDFIAFINEYKTECTKIFYNEYRIDAVFNYSTVSQADYGDSCCSMLLDKTKDFEEFLKHIDTGISQKSFIRLLKRMEPYIVEFDRKQADDMDIIEVAEHLHATKNINSVQRNTQQAFVIDAEIKAGNSSFEIPRYITFKIPIFKNDIELEAAFEAELFIDAMDGGFEVNLACYKLDQTIEDTVRELTRQVQRGCEDINSFMV